jgi:hypothetical protein
MNAPDTRRLAIIAKIRKLSGITTDRGASEAEANYAAQRVAALVAEHDVSATELSVRADASACITDEFTELNAADDWLPCATLIARVYGCRVWMCTEMDDPFDLGLPMRVRRIRYFGCPVDVAACVATTAIIYTGLQTESAAFKGDRASFRLGMSHRLQARLGELWDRKRREYAGAPTGSALIVLKDQLVTEEYAKLNMRLSSHRTAGRGRPVNSAAFAAGQAAGARAQIDPSAALYGARGITQRRGAR